MKTKEEILSEFYKQFQGKYFDTLNNTDQETIKQIKNFISQSLDEYADWKIRECLPDQENYKTGDDNESLAYNSGFEDCRQLILSNKDKK